MTASTPVPTVANRMPRVWIGHWLLAVATLHTVYAGVFFGNAYVSIAQRGFINSVGRDPFSGAAVWFGLFGAAMALIGLAIIPLERSQQHTALRQLGLGLVLLCVLGITLMPASGFWLGLPAAIAMLRKRGA